MNILCQTDKTTEKVTMAQSGSADEASHSNSGSMPLPQKLKPTRTEPHFHRHRIKRTRWRLREDKSETSPSNREPENPASDGPRDSDDGCASSEDEDTFQSDIMRAKMITYKLRKIFTKQCRDCNHTLTVKRPSRRLSDKKYITWHAFPFLSWYDWLRDSMKDLKSTRISCKNYDLRRLLSARRTIQHSLLKVL